MTDPSNAKVLLIIDAQVNMLLGGSAIPSAQATRSSIEYVLSKARAAQPLPRIIHVRNNGDQGDVDEPNTPGWELAVLPEPKEAVIDKFQNNAFEGTALDALVPKDAHLTVVGMQSEFCIRATCLAARARGNKVLLVHGAHATYHDTEGSESKDAQQIERDIELQLEEAGVKIIETSDVTF